MAAPVLAADQPARSAEDRAVADAFHLGLSQTDRDPTTAQLEVVGFGHSFVLKSRVGDRELGISCLLCTPSEMLTAARSFGARVAAEQGQGPPARLKVKNIRPGDTVLVDGVPFAPLSKAHPIETGEHRIAVQEPDDEAYASVRVPPGSEVVFDAEAVLAARRRDRRLKALLGGLGATSAAIGGVFLWLDGNCAAAAVDASGHCRRQHDLAPAGWALLATGIAAELALLIWVVLPERAAEKPGGAP